MSKLNYRNMLLTENHETFLRICEELEEKLQFATDHDKAVTPITERNILQFSFSSYSMTDDQKTRLTQRIHRQVANLVELGMLERVTTNPMSYRLTDNARIYRENTPIFDFPKWKGTPRYSDLKLTKNARTTLACCLIYVAETNMPYFCMADVWDHANRALTKGMTPEHFGEAAVHQLCPHACILERAPLRTKFVYASNIGGYMYMFDDRYLAFLNGTSNTHKEIDSADPKKHILDEMCREIKIIEERLRIVKNSLTKLI